MVFISNRLILFIVLNLVYSVGLAGRVATYSPFIESVIEDCGSWVFYDELEEQGLHIGSSLTQSVYIEGNKTVRFRVDFDLVDEWDNREPGLVEKRVFLQQYEPFGPHHFSQKDRTITFWEHGIGYPFLFQNERQVDLVTRKIEEVVATLSQARTSQRSLSQVFKKAGFSHVVHATRPENLEALCRDGTLRPGKQLVDVVYGDPIGNHEGVFMSVVEMDQSTEALLKLIGGRLPCLLFPINEVVDAHPFHISPGYPYGRFLRIHSDGHKLLASASSVDKDALERFLTSFVRSKGNELVVKQGVSLSGIEKILVPRGEGDEWKKKLGEEWASRIEEVDRLYSQILPKKSPPSELSPYSTNSDAIVFAYLRGSSVSIKEIIELLVREYPKLQDLYSNASYEGLGDWKKKEEKLTSNCDRLRAALSLVVEDPQPLLSYLGF